MKRKIFLLFFTLVVLTSLMRGQNKTIIKPEKVSTPPVIDGYLNDDIWKTDAGITGFKTFYPDYGKDVPFKTIVWVAYDSENLYYAFRCFDPEPDKIKATVDARDKIRDDDWVCINLDSFNDQQTLYCIYSNANGIQMDTRFAAGNEDLGMDLVFYSAGKVDEQGYTIEIKLPLKSIRFSNKEPVMMAATFERYISRLSTGSTYPPLDPAQGMAFLTQTQPLQYEGVKHYTLLEILPSATYSYKAEQTAGRMVTNENKPDAGLTIKYGITSQIILDATLNPDFSQVEADAGQVDANLRYELFYPEKRPFFQEGNENFQIGSTNSSGQDPIVSLVHTRNFTNPLAGLKLSGKIGIKNSLSMMYAADRIIDSDKEIYGDFAHFPIIRYKRSLSNDGYLGAIATSVQKRNSSNYVYGADGNVRINKSSILEFHSLMSKTNDTASGINNKSGHAIGINFHSEQRNLSYAITAKNISELFISQTGFIDRNGITLFTGMISPKIFTDSKVFRRFDFQLNSGQLRDNLYNKWETNNSLSITSLLGGALRANIRYNYSSEIYKNERFSTKGLQFTLTGRVGNKINGTIVYRRGDAVFYSEPCQGFGNLYLAELRYLPFEKLHIQANLTYQDLYRKTDDSKIFDYLLIRGKITYQINKYLFIRAITEYNDFRKSLNTDFLASFTYIPGTVCHIGYGSISEYKFWDGNNYRENDRMMEMKKAFFVKISYLFRL
jgi:hypothetical protein